MLLMQILNKLIINKLHLKTVMVEKREPEKQAAATEEAEEPATSIMVQAADVKVPNEKATAAGSEQEQVIKPVTAVSATATTEPTSP